MLKSVYKKPTKESNTLVITGIVFATLGILAGTKPEVIEELKTKAQRGFEKIKNKITK